MKPWRIVYRSRLAVCNYRCGYCPLPKRDATALELEEDGAGLGRFVGWAAGCGHGLEILFAPNGEALLHKAYWRALSQLSRMENVWLAAAQTNLSMPLQFAEDIRPERIALWATFHPGAARLPEFLAQLSRLGELGIRHSVGVVGLKRHFKAIRELRESLPEETYLWINPYKARPDYYTSSDIAFLTATDPCFPVHLRDYESKGVSCQAGDSMFMVDDLGDVRRCLRARAVLGNLYDPAFPAFLRPRPCPARQCRCYLEQVCHPELDAEAIYGATCLPRIPVPPASRNGERRGPRENNNGMPG